MRKRLRERNEAQYQSTTSISRHYTTRSWSRQTNGRACFPLMLLLVGMLSMSPGWLVPSLIESSSEILSQSANAIIGVTQHHTNLQRKMFPRVAIYSLTATHTNTTKSKSSRRRSIKYPMTRVVPQSSKDHDRGRMDPVVTKGCVPNAPWQTKQFPTCNALHEMQLDGPFYATDASGSTRDIIRLVNNGFWRDVWIVPDWDLTPRVVKTLRYGHDCNERNIDRNRRDAMALERLTSSRHVVDIYGYCSTSAFFELSDGGDVNKEIFSTHNMTSLRRLQIATQAAMGLADAHTIDFEDRATIAHTDIGGGQYILINGFYKLNDFNRARFILRNNVTNKNCPYLVGKNPGKNRSPEEYRYDPQTEKVDTYSFGNIIYTLLHKEYPFQDESSKVTRKKVMKGYRPSVFEDIWNSTDPATKALKEAMILCHEHHPKKRPSMRYIESFLKSTLEQIDPGRLKEWGEV